LRGPAEGYGARVQPTSPPSATDPQDLDDLAAQVSRLARERGVTIAVAESLTGGMIAQALAASEASSTWFRGSLVAYSSEVKHDLLEVPPGPVVSPAAASAMVRSVRRLLGADLAVAVTGAGGPEPEDGSEPGTVFLALDAGVPGGRAPDGSDTHRVLCLLCDADEVPAVLATTAATALQMLLDALTAPEEELSSPS
jgi:nicotinamide-nucleotide amidase